MKKHAFGLIAVLAVAFLAAPVLRAEHGSDFKAFQKAVKHNPAYEEGKDVRWFKVLIADRETGDAEFKMTLPIALVEVVLKCSDTRHVRIDDDDCEIDLKALWAELKKAGPMALIEIQGDGEIIKVWLE